MADIAAVVQAVAATFALFSIFLVARQISLLRRETRSRVMHELEVDARNFEDVFWELDEDVNWPENRENLRRSILLMSFFEKVCIFVREGVLSPRDVQILFGYRMRQFLANPHIVTHIEKNSMKMDFSLIKEMQKLAVQ